MTAAGMPATNDPKAIAAWKRKRVQAFKLMAPSALSFVASECNVSVTLYDGNEIKRRYGHNRAVRPAKIIHGTSLEDNAQKNHKNGFIKYRTFFRVWARTKSQRDTLADRGVELLAKASDRDGGLEDLDDGFKDMGPDLNIEMWELEIHTLARDIGITVWDNASLIVFLDRVLVRAEELQKEWRGGRYSPLEVALTKEIGA